MRAVRLRTPIVFPPIRLYHHDPALDFLSARLTAERIWDFDQTLLLLKYVQPGDIVVDVGANIGYYARLLGRCAGRRGTVYAFEPDPDNLRVLRANAARAWPCKVEILPVALGDTAGPALLYRSPDNFGDHRLSYREGRGTCPIDVVRADDVLGASDRPVTLIKIDVQGTEEKVLQGMRRLIDRNAPHLAVFVEFSPELLRLAGSSADSFLDLIDRLGARVLRFGSNGRELMIWPADHPALASLAEDYLGREIEDIGENLILFFSREAEERFRRAQDAPWPGRLGRLWRWSGYA
jgi:FkbM family methyltransferase